MPEGSRKASTASRTSTTDELSKLTLSDIADNRAYERERDAFRRDIVALKRPRRVAVGPLVTVVFENRTTMLFQVQEMARAESMSTDEQIQTELDVYNELIPGHGELSATLFIELTTEAQLREWLPRLVGIELAVELRLDGGVVVKAVVEESHASQLTRDEVTASVHFVKFHLDAAAQQLFRDGPGTLAVAHPDYEYASDLGYATRASLVADWSEQ